MLQIKETDQSKVRRCEASAHNNAMCVWLDHCKTRAWKCKFTYFMEGFQIVNTKVWVLFDVSNRK